MPVNDHRIETEPSFYIRFAAAALYRAAYLLHQRIFLRKGKPLQNTKLVVIGSYRTGGAGKTPFCAWLAGHLASQGKRVAILCHQYASDEAEMLRKKFEGCPTVKVHTTGNRYRLAHRLDSTRNFDVILCDDGFEDNRLAGEVALILSWETEPNRIRDLWPLGHGKSLAKDHLPKGGARHETLSCSGTAPEIQFITDNVSSLAKGSRALSDFKQVHVFCGLGDPERFCRDLQNKGIRISRREFVRDHDRNYAKKLALFAKENPDDAVVISEKDASRLPEKQRLTLSNVFVAYQKVVVAHPEKLDYYIFKKEGSRI